MTVHLSVKSLSQLSGRVIILPRDTSVMPRGQGDVDQWKIIDDRARLNARSRPCLVPEKKKSAWDTSEQNGSCSQLSILLKGKQDPLPTPVLLQSFQQLPGAGYRRPLHPCGLFSLSSSQKKWVLDSPSVPYSSSSHSWKDFRGVLAIRAQGNDPKGKLGKNPRGVHVRICLHPGVILEITGNTAWLGFDYQHASRDLGLIRVIDRKESCQ